MDFDNLKLSENNGEPIYFICADHMKGPRIPGCVVCSHAALLARVKELRGVLEAVREDIRGYQDVDDNAAGDGIHANLFMRLVMDIDSVLAKQP